MGTLFSRAKIYRPDGETGDILFYPFINVPELKLPRSGKWIHLGGGTKNRERGIIY